jgi:heterodisulfide reductase subunit D
MKQILDQAEACTECELCNEVCPSYRATGEVLFSPMQRLKTIIKLFEGGEISDKEIESLYNCLICMRCELVCQEEIKVSEIVTKARAELCDRGLGPPIRHNKVIKGLLAKGNAVNGDPQKRLEWLPEDFPRNESDTLLYMGCLASYLVKDAATSSYEVLKKLGVNFMILEDEGCCGSILFTSGRVDLAGEWFQKNVERFKSLGIRRVIVTCPVCQERFKHSYAEVLGGFDFSVYHIAEIIYDLVKSEPDLLPKIQKTVTYQDPCLLARGEGFYEEPRRILRWCGMALKEMPENRAEAPCCGAGGGVRAAYPDLATKIASNLLNTVETETIVNACPFCTYNLNHSSRDGEMMKRSVYFTNMVLDSLMRSRETSLKEV